jgi:hypothetical protein
VAPDENYGFRSCHITVDVRTTLLPPPVHRSPPYVPPYRPSLVLHERQLGVDVHKPLLELFNLVHQLVNLGLDEVRWFYDIRRLWRVRGSIHVWRTLQGRRGSQSSSLSSSGFSVPSLTRQEQFILDLPALCLEIFQRSSHGPVKRLSVVRIVSSRQ